MTFTTGKQLLDPVASNELLKKITKTQRYFSDVASRWFLRLHISSIKKWSHFVPILQKHFL